MRIFAVAFALSISSVCSAADWRAEQPCATRSIPFKQVVSANCSLSYCASIPKNGELCVCLKKEAEEYAAIQLKRPGHTESWEVEILPVIMDLNALQLRSVSDRGPDSDTWFFSLLKWESNGLAVRRWDIRLISPVGVSSPHEVADFGILSQLTRSASGKSCRLLSGQWKNGWDEKRGEGLYFVGEWWEARNGSLVRSRDLPTIHRRLLFTFQNERGAAFNPAKPIPWFRHPDTRIGMPSQVPLQK